MAIVIEEQQQKNSGLLTEVIFGIIIIALIIAVYLVFFSPAPLVEKALPPNISEIQNVSLDISPLNNYSVYEMITATSGIGAPNATTTGRQNPFQPF